MEIKPEQVALCQIWLKICRETNKPLPDNIVDVIGYAITHDMVKEKK